MDVGVKGVELARKWVREQLVRKTVFMGV